MVEDWIKYSGRWHEIGWEASVVTRRILAWLAHSPFVLQDGNHEFYRSFVKSLARQVRYLRRTINETDDGVERLQSALAITAACISMAGQGRFARQSFRRLEHELTRQILPDGGHISRNPRALIDVLADLLPIRQAFVAQGLEMPPSMVQSVDRMMPMVRFFRHGDGALAHFNGMGSTPGDLVATILAYDDARGAPPVNAPHSGYQRPERWQFGGLGRYRILSCLGGFRRWPCRLPFLRVFFRGQPDCRQLRRFREIKSDVAQSRQINRCAFDGDDRRFLFLPFSVRQAVRANAGRTDPVRADRSAGGAGRRQGREPGHRVS